MSDAGNKVVLSGVKSTGASHLGNYFGAMKQFVALQDSGHEVYFFVADYHSLTGVQDGEALRAMTWDVALDYLAIGLDPEKSVLFRQSDVPQHAELSWILSCVCPKGHLDRAHAFKDAEAKGKKINAGTYTYPVLMAADILIYGANLVPVGQDQLQHVEYAQDFQEKFNHIFNTDVLVRPEPLVPKETALVLGTDGQKMSKSYGNTIALFEAKKSFEKKIKRIVTDSTPVEDPKDPDACPVHALYKLFDPAGAPAVAEKYRAGGYGYGDAKKELIEAANLELEPLRERRAELASRPKDVEDILQAGAAAARKRAEDMMVPLRKACGLRA